MKFVHQQALTKDRPINKPAMYAAFVLRRKHISGNSTFMQSLVDEIKNLLHSNHSGYHEEIQLTSKYGALF